MAAASSPRASTDSMRPPPDLLPRSSSDLQRLSPADAAISRARAAVKVDTDQRTRDRPNEQEVSADFRDYRDNGCQVELTDMKLTSLPEELVDILKDHVRWLAMNKNSLTGLSGMGPRFHELTRLRYLNMRNNLLTHFPPEILSIPTMEMLDLRENQIEVIPEQLSQLVNLKKFCIVNNNIQKIPTCIVHMPNLAYLMVNRNPVNFPPPELWRLLGDDAKLDKEHSMELQKRETKQLKKLLADHMQYSFFPGEAFGAPSDNTDTPKPMKRNASGRFPIRPSNSSIDIAMMARPDSRPNSPLPPRPPPVPLTSSTRLNPHPYNDSSSLQPADPNVAAALNERYRSNSESQMSSHNRIKRMGMISRRPSADKTRTDSNITSIYRLSHLRGLSYGSALQNGNTANGVGNSSSPAAPEDTDGQRSMFVSRLSSLPENKRQSHANVPRSVLSQTIVFAAYQLKFPLDYLVRAVQDSGTKQSPFENIVATFYQNVNELSDCLDRSENDDEEMEEDDSRRSQQQIQRSCEACVESFETLVITLQYSARLIVQQANPRYVRSLMHSIYGVLLEFRNSSTKLVAKTELNGMATARRRRPIQEKAASPEYRPVTSLRVKNRSGTVTSANRSISSRHTQWTLPKSTAATNGTSRRLNSTAASIAATVASPRQPRFSDTESLPRLTRSNTLRSTDAEDDPSFNNVYWRLTKALDSAMIAFPRCEACLTDCKRRNISSTESSLYDNALEKGRAVAQDANQLKVYMSNMRLEDQYAQESDDFWRLSTEFTTAWTVFATSLKGLQEPGLLPDEVKFLLRPVQQNVKEASTAIRTSPWARRASGPGSRKNSTTAMSSLAAAAAASAIPPVPSIPSLALNTKVAISPSGEPLSAVSSYTNQSNTVSSGDTTPLPATPLSAALGSAALATMPSSGSQSGISTNGIQNYYTSSNGLERQRSVSQRRY